LIYTAATRDSGLKSTLKAVETAEKIKDREKRMREAVCTNQTATQVNAEDNLDHSDNADDSEVVNEATEENGEKKIICE
jgi:hypothetical protein